MKISSSCYAIHGLFTLSPWVVNSGFIVGESKTLIVDAGANYLSAQTIFGYATSAREENELFLVNTEPHFDHIGGNCYFSEKGIPIYGHEGINRTSEEFYGLAEEFNKTITSSKRREAREEQTLFVNTHPVNPNHKISALRTTLDLGNKIIEIILTPGHSPQNLMVFVPSENVIYSGDTIIEGYIPNMEDSTVEGWKNWMKSLNIIEELDPGILVPGHGKVLRGNEITKQIELTKEYLIAGIESGKAPTAL
ncbi:MAG: MBL fold metallo-hydrolase [Bacteroidetes bacterium]|nr:MBL fold metallo-hydrolase [Bacteroidota bacterium]